MQFGERKMLQEVWFGFVGWPPDRRGQKSKVGCVEKKTEEWELMKPALMNICRVSSGKIELGMPHFCGGLEIAVYRSAGG